MGQSTYPHGFNGDLVVRGVPVVNSYSKSAWWVDSAGSNQGDGTFKRPFASIEIAINSGKVVAGDQIHCKAGHVETVTAAAGLDLDVAGVTIFFHGQGSNRAQITFTTAPTADMDIDAANITLVNPLFVAGIDALTGPIDVNAADFTIINGEWRDAPAMGTTDAIVADAAADRMTIDGWRFIPSTTGTQKQSNIQVAAANDVILRNIDIFGDFGTGAIENGTAWINALLENVRINNTSASPTVGILLQATSTGAMRNVHIRVASGTTYLTANNDMEFFDCWGTGTDATAAENIGTSLGSDIEGRLGAESATDPISEVLSGAGGITTWKTAAAYATGVSMSEVLGYIQDGVRRGSGTSMAANKSVADALGTDGTTITDSATSVLGVIGSDTGTTAFASTSVVANQDGNVLEREEQLQQLAAMAGFYNSGNYLAVTADLTNATWNTVAAHEIATVTGAVRMLILPQCTSTVVTTGTNGTFILGDETNTSSLIASSLLDALATGEWWVDATITRTLVTRSQMNALEFVIGNGKDIGYTIGTNAATNGTIVFHIWWVPIDATGAVAAGAGGVL